MNYEDTYVHEGTVRVYFPTYEDLNDSELRGYFTWRTQYRRGNVQKTHATYVYLYLYELLNQIGVDSPLDGFQKLKVFWAQYEDMHEFMRSHLSTWMADYLVYYRLDPSLLDDTPQVIWDRHLTVLDHILEQEDSKVLYAVKELAPKWISRSRFYKQNQADCDQVILEVLRKMALHYEKKTRKTLVEALFGKPICRRTGLFDNAVVAAPRKWDNQMCIIAPYFWYRCENGMWTVTRYRLFPEAGADLEVLLKAIDAILREEFGDKKPIAYTLKTKWILQLIRQEAQALVAEKKAREAKKITIDYSQLAKIRREAAVTQERLTVEEEWEEAPLPVQPLVPPPPEPEPEPVSGDGSRDTPLSSPEYRLLQCLLYGGSLDWSRREGHILSVLMDGINDKLYDTFLDTVVEDTPGVVEDYIEDLKEMVVP